MIKNKRVHIKIRGVSRKDHYHDFLSQAVTDLGLTGFAVLEGDALEIVAEGERNMIWELVKKCTAVGFKVRIDEFVFYFRDPEGTFTSFSLT